MLNNGQLDDWFNSTDFPFMNAINLHDGELPGLVVSPTNSDSLPGFLNCKWDTNCDGNWAFQPDDGWFQTWPLPEDMSYTDATLKTAALGGFPLGDLYRWWPNEYTQWEAQKDDEYQKIYYALETGDVSQILSVEPQPGNIIPANYTLSQNYPNPFNPTTQFEYSIPVSGQVALIVYNSLGEKVATIFNGYQKAGNYKATFDGSGLASGIYVYRLESGNVSIAKKFILAK